MRLVARLAIALARRAGRDGSARLVPVGTHHEAGPAAREGGGRGRRGSLRHERAGGPGPRRDRRPRRLVPADDRASRGGRGARAELPDDRLARAPHAADGDPRPRRGAARGARRGSGDSHGLAERDRRRGGQARAARRRRPRPREARHAPLHGAARGSRHGSAARAGARGRSPRRRSGAGSTTRRRSRPSR